MIKAILFDFAGVIVTEWRWEKLTGEPVPENKPFPQEVYRLNDLVDKGTIQLKADFHTYGI